ncbi:hypothetical protein [Sulfuriferula nivalis]|uniref:Transmembrane protein n=1 Tax=Sulfuriferula nivalis TaxID=2675298 RepID=A0A809RES3_9PROT|nr:hypothetical protein [Sulfuriferula nivalis]BBP00126.1 hypothetical protein SFSGTM_08340 [Sulfuriferula nivalis]
MVETNPSGRRITMRKTDFTAYVIAVGIGMCLWFAATASGGKREAWDTPDYWSLAYPGAIIACGVLGYFFNHRPWRWPVALFVGQFIAMTIRNGELGNLWPLGLLLFLVISLPGIFTAKLGAWINSKMSSQQR